jgi:hypothetical protein
MIMDTETTATQPGGAPTDIVQIPAPANPTISAREAARSLASFRLKQRDSDGEAALAPPSQNESADADAPADAASSITSETPGEGTASPEGSEPEATAQAEPPADEAPIEPPRSWTKEAHERFASLPRETQEYVAQREQERDRELRRVQNESAAERAALETERTRVETARVQYETALPGVLANLHQQRLAEFPDVRSNVDIERLAREDWPRYMQWDALQKRFASSAQEQEVAALRRAQEQKVRLSELINRENARLLEKAPEVADPAQREKLNNTIVGMLRELGFSEPELNELLVGQERLSVHDHRLQLLLRDGARFREAQKAAKEASTKPLPPVQRPGVAQGKAAAQHAAVASLARRLDQTGSLKDAARLLAERRKAR